MRLARTWIWHGLNAAEPFVEGLQTGLYQSEPEPLSESIKPAGGVGNQDRDVYFATSPSVSSMRVPTGSVRKAIFKPILCVMSVNGTSMAIPSACSFLTKA
jgi:hypothetical protein